MVIVIVRMFFHLQQKMRTSTAEALSRLDMVGAVRDHRRFNYVCKVTPVLDRIFDFIPKSY